MTTWQLMHFSKQLTLSSNLSVSVLTSIHVIEGSDQDVNLCCCVSSFKKNLTIACRQLHCIMGDIQWVIDSELSRLNDSSCLDNGCFIMNLLHAVCLSLSLSDVEPWEGDGSALCCSVRSLRGGPCFATGADGPQHEEQSWGNTAGSGSHVRPPAGGLHATDRPPQPHELQYTQTHASSPGRTEWPLHYRSSVAGGRHGR